MIPETVYLMGAGGHAKVVLDILRSLGIRVPALFDADPGIKSRSGLPVGSPAEVRYPLILSIGDNRARCRVAGGLGGPFAIAVAPSAVVSPSALVGAGSVVMQRAVIQAEARIGRHAIINTAASVDHECRIGDFAHISPHATLCGNVRVGTGAHVGAGAVVIPGVRIGDWAVVGAGAVVIADVPAGVTVAGNPARPIRTVCPPENMNPKP